MNELAKLVTIINNDNNSVLLKVKNNKRMGLIKTGCFLKTFITKAEK